MKDLTEGSPGKVLWKFSVPMFVSVIFQQMYNIADSVIAGKFAGEDALAAVGASYPVTMIFMAIAVGSNIGCSVIISNLFGAKKYKEMKTAVTTTLIAVKLMADGVLRGAGAMKQFMTATFVDLVLRVILAFILAGSLGSTGIWLSWPIGWVVAAVLSIIFYRKNFSAKALREKNA